MKRVSILLLIVALYGGMSSCSPFSKKLELKTEIDTMSYYFGMSRTDGIMEYLANQAGIDTAYMDDFYKGFKKGAENYGPEDAAYLEGMRIAHLINNQWIDGVNRDIFLGDSTKTVNRIAVLKGFYHGVKSPNEMNRINAQAISQTKMEAIKEDNKRIKFADNISSGEKFLAENKSKDGVQTTPSGLQYKIITEGKGDIPDEKARVKVNYRGTLIDGTEFDSSAKNNAPATFGLDQVIKGWTEALKMMPVGSKWELYVPQDLAYGSMDRSNIPPYSTLIFEVELLDIEK